MTTIVSMNPKSKKAKTTQNIKKIPKITTAKKSDDDPKARMIQK